MLKLVSTKGSDISKLLKSKFSWDGGQHRYQADDAPFNLLEATIILHLVIRSVPRIERQGCQQVRRECLKCGLQVLAMNRMSLKATYMNRREALGRM